MPQFRPAGLSDDDSASDDDRFFDFPARPYQPPQQSEKKRIEIDFQNALVNGNVLEVERIVSKEMQNSVNMVFESGWTPLMHACFHAHETIVKLLLEKGADPNLHTSTAIPLMLACSDCTASNDAIYNIITNLIDKGCALNVSDKNGHTPLMNAIKSGRVDVVQKLLDVPVNIEMRDQDGWTAVFWAVNYNKPEILEMLIAKNARLTEVDRSGRTPNDIAHSHDFQECIDILNKYLKIEEEELPVFSTKLTTWHDFYPGIKPGEKIGYENEISHLLYGMSCERLEPLIHDAGLNLREFLLLNEDQMLDLGIDMPYERQRLRLGLRNFHMRGWKLNAVAGLYARKADNYGVLDCLTTLGTHLQQVYILEATLQYTLREFKKVQQQLKFEPPDSPLNVKLKESVKNMLTNINSIRRETNNMKVALTKISKNNPEPADYIKEKSTREVALGYVSEVIVMCTLGYLVYNAKHFMTGFGTK